MIADKGCAERGCPMHEVGDEGVEMVPASDELKQCVYEFFTTYLNRVEETDSGRLWNPVAVSCCRALMLEPLGNLLEKMRVLAGAETNPLTEVLREEEQHED